MAFNYYPNTKHYGYTPKDNPKDRVEVEIGDSQDSSTFFPQVKIKRWDNEVNSSIRLVHSDIPGTVSYSDDGTKITWQKGPANNRWKAIFYHRDDLDEGGFEFEIHLPKKPPVNYLEFSINIKDLDWFYQPPLTQEEIDRGMRRPDNVVGSYAVYHKTKGGMNDAAGMEYKVGKAFHVYRPHVVDANNNETWGTLELDEVNGILRISVDQTWLDKAVYPVVVDPTFGYTTLGSSEYEVIADDNFYYGSGSFSVRVGESTTTTEAGDITKLTVGLDDGGGSGATALDVKAFVNETDSVASNSHGQTGTATQNVTGISGSKAWFDITLSCSVTASNEYILNLVGDVDDLTDSVVIIIGDYVGGSSQKIYREYPHSYSSPESPWTNSVYAQDWRLSIYATYTASGGGAAPRQQLLTLLDVG